jgi:UDP-N-acetylmuramoyl-tripeptide--D-alanyl-D-alanine ligase
VPLSAAAAGIGAMSAPKMRNEWRQVGGMGLLADCYNANPPSMRAAVELLASIPSQGAKVAVVGTMRELGTHAEALHRAAAEHITGLLGKGIDRVLATGDFVPAFEGAADPRIIVAEDPIEGYATLRDRLQGNETVLLKGSRGVALERLIPLLEEDFGTQSAPHTHAGA